MRMMRNDDLQRCLRLTATIPVRPPSPPGGSTRKQETLTVPDPARAAAGTTVSPPAAVAALRTSPLRGRRARRRGLRIADDADAPALPQVDGDTRASSLPSRGPAFAAAGTIGLTAPRSLRIPDPGMPSPANRTVRFAAHARCDAYAETRAGRPALAHVQGGADVVQHRMPSRFSSSRPLMADFESGRGAAVRRVLSKMRRNIS